VGWGQIGRYVKVAQRYQEGEKGIAYVDEDDNVIMVMVI